MKAALHTLGKRMPPPIRDATLAFVQHTFVMLSPNIRAERGVHIPCGSQITASMVRIGRHTNFSSPAVIKGKGTVRIGSFCNIGRVTIIVQNHAMHYASTSEPFYRRFFDFSILKSGQDISIGHDVWIGDNVTILPGVSIGNGAVIGAGAVVSRDIPPYAVAAGVPARVLRKRFRQRVISQLEEISWWSWSEKKIKANRAFFEADLGRVDDVRKLALMSGSSPSG